MLHDIDSSFDENDDTLDAEVYDSRPVPGIGSLLLNQVKPRRYPFNIYERDDDSSSGLAGTLYPDGRFTPLPSTGVQMSLQRTGRFPKTVFWEDKRAMKVEGEVVWDGVINGSLDYGMGPKQPTRRLWDGSLTGDWPNHPPRAEKQVDPIKARYAADLEAQEKQFWDAYEADHEMNQSSN